MKTCCFTGHRIIKITPELVQRLRDTIINMIECGVTDFYNGGAIGFDMLCAETVIALKAEYKYIKLHMLLPCPPEEHVKRWNKAQIARYNEILQAADSVIVLSKHYTTAAARCIKTECFTIRADFPWASRSVRDRPCVLRNKKALML